MECKKSIQRWNFRHLFSEGPLGPGRPCSYFGCPSAGTGDPRRRLAPSGGVHGMSDSFRCSPPGNGVRGMSPEPRALPVVCVGGFISHPLAPLLSPDSKHLGTAVGSRGSTMGPRSSEVGFWGSGVGSLPLSSPVLVPSFRSSVLAGLPAVGNFVGSGPSLFTLSLLHLQRRPSRRQRLLDVLAKHRAGRSGGLGSGSWGGGGTRGTRTDQQEKGSVWGRKRANRCNKCLQRGAARRCRSPKWSGPACNVNAITLPVFDVSPSSPPTGTASICRKIEAK